LLVLVSVLMSGGVPILLFRFGDVLVIVEGVH